MKYIDDLIRKGIEFSRIEKQQLDKNSFPVDSPERDELMSKYHLLNEFFTTELKDVKSKFSKYLQLGEVEERNFLSKFFGKTRK